MASWENCPDDILINLFKNCDLKTRLKANQICKRWNELLKDPSTNMDDVYRINLKIRNWAWAVDAVENEMTTTNALALIGKTKCLDLRGYDSATVSLLKEMVDEGRLRIDKFISTSTSFMASNAFLPSSIRELILNSEHPNLNIDWSRFPKLERLSLFGIFLDPSSIALPSLKSLFHYYGHCDSNRLNENLARLPSLEELRLYQISFDTTSFRNFLRTIQNQLPKLRSLYFDTVSFQNVKTTSNSESFNFPVLKKIGFDTCFYPEIVQKFIRSSELDRIHFAAVSTIGFIEEIYNLTASLSKKNEKFELTLDLFGDDKKQKVILPLCWGDFYQAEEPDIEIPYTLAAFEHILTELSLRCMSNSDRLNQLLIGGSYEKLTYIYFRNSSALNDEILKIISQSCSVLKKLRIEESKGISQKGLKWFLINWSERKSKQLMIECVDSISIEGLFGTYSGRGILEELSMKEEDDQEENGGSSATAPKKSKKSMENQKRWMIYQKLFPCTDKISLAGTRLVIWDESDSNGLNQKILVIKDYDKERLDTFKKLMI